MGFLVDNKHVITCAHVISATEGSDDRECERPGEPVTVKFLFIDGQPIRIADVATWCPPKNAPCPESRDIAVLQINSNPPKEACPAHVVDREVHGNEFMAYGYPTRYASESPTWVYGEICDRLDTRCVQLQHSRNKGIFVQGGFSGGLVWDLNLQGVIGMIVSAVAEDGIACAIPNEILAEAWPPLKDFIVRPPFAQPIAYNCPYHRNKNFTGRKELLAVLRAALTSGLPTACRQVITGMGGVGKTQLAIEYIYRFHRDYPVIWWVRAEEPPTLAADYAGLAIPLGLPVKDLANQAIIAAVRNWLETNTGWLLVFDNASDVDAIYDYLPRTSNGAVIITSRDPHWRDASETLDLNVFIRRDSIELLNKLAHQHGDASADALAAELGDLPLAIAQAGTYCATKSKHLSDYLALLSRHQAALLVRGKPSREYPRTVATTWNIALTKLHDDCPAATDLSNLCAFLAPDDIPRSVLLDKLQILTDTVEDTSLKNELDFDDAVNALASYSLVGVREDSLSVHRLVQMITRDQLGDNAAVWIEAVTKMINSSFLFAENDLSTWPLCERLISHALAAASYADYHGVAPEINSDLLNKAGKYLLVRAQFPEARSALEKALAIRLAKYGPNDLRVARTLINLGIVFEELGDLEGAKHLFERALKIEEGEYGCDHPQVATTLANLGNVLMQLGELNNAKHLFERALKIEEGEASPNRRGVARTLNGLGIALQQLGDLKGAKQIYERALATKEDEYGSDHPQVAITLNNLGIVLKKLGDLDGAKQLYERALAIQLATYGPGHPHVAMTCSNLGNVLQRLGDLKGAKQLYERSAKIRKTSSHADNERCFAEHKQLDS
jgi:tetratricopeptide (TPR) repeat protein